MSSAGQANEAGSVFRRDAAVYFAVHALVGVSISSLPSTHPATRIDFETPDPTDDIRISYRDGTRFYVSAKRTAGLNGPTRETVAGWVGQAPTLKSGDFLVLAVSETTQPLRNLHRSLERLRAGADTTRSVDVKGLKWLDNLVPPKLRSIVRERAHIVEIVQTPTSNNDYNILVTMMNTLVEDHQGAAALSCLADHFHTTAGQGSGSRVEQWLATLEAKGFRLRPSAGGSSTVQYATAINLYHRALTKAQGVINLSLLADDLGPLPRQDILDGVQVADRSGERSTRRSLRPVVRRKRRLLIIGQPGTGKTKTLAELAAWCTQDQNAPEPIWVKLPRLVKPNRPDSLELADLIAEAANLVPVDDRAYVRTHLQQAAGAGDAILILDGLDECGDHIGWVCQELTTLITEIHKNTAIVIATRPSAEMPAQRLGLDEVILETPHDLKKTMDAVLEHCASARIPAPERKTWLAGRRAWLREAVEQHEAMLAVPQLALLVVLLAAESTNADVPHSRAQILHTAVATSVTRWELRRFADHANRSWSPDLSPEMLLTGFITLGRLLDGQAEQPKATALGTLTDVLRNPQQWDLSPAKARELAPQVLRFWDEHIGVFTVDESDSISARSKVFCEVATAMWVSLCTNADLQAWTEETIPFYDAREVISLAQGLDARVSRALLDLGETDPVAALAVGTAVLNNIPQLDGDELEQLVGQLVRHALDIQRGATELPERMNRPGGKSLESRQKRAEECPSSWRLVEALCAIDLTAGLRPKRDQAIADLQLSQPYPCIARATAALVDARADDRRLNNQELRDVQATINIAIPDRPHPVQKRGKVYVITDSPAPRGLGIVAELATRHLDQLAVGSDRKIYDMSQHVPWRNGIKVVQRLNEAGVQTKPWKRPNRLSGFIAAFAQHAEHERMLLQEIASLGDKATELTGVDRWSLADLGDLMHATGYADVDFPNLRSAFTDDTAELRRPWLRAIAVLHGLDLDRLAAQAQHVVTVAEDPTRHDEEWTVISEEPAPPTLQAKFDRMGDDEQQAGVAGLFAHSSWIVRSSKWLLFHSTATWDRDKLFDKPLDEWTPSRSSTFRQVAIIADPPSRDLLERAAASEHSSYRHAARRAIELLSSLDPDGTIHDKLANDSDQWVRGNLRTDPAASAAEYWSCPWCPCKNTMHVEDCQECAHGVRPEPDDRAP